MNQVVIAIFVLFCAYASAEDTTRTKCLKQEIGNLFQSRDFEDVLKKCKDSDVSDDYIQNLVNLMNADYASWDNCNNRGDECTNEDVNTLFDTMQITNNQIDGFQFLAPSCKNDIDDSKKTIAAIAQKCRVACLKEEIGELFEDRTFGDVLKECIADDGMTDKLEGTFKRLDGLMNSDYQKWDDCVNAGDKCTNDDVDCLFERMTTNNKDISSLKLQARSCSEAVDESAQVVGTIAEVCHVN